MAKKKKATKKKAVKKKVTKKKATKKKATKKKATKKKATTKSQPMCQDTGTILIYVNHPKGYDQNGFMKILKKAVVKATKVGYLRQNSVDTLTGKNDTLNIGLGHPSVHFHEWSKKSVEVKSMLKGGGCENVGAQYSLPNNEISAGRDLEGVRKAALDAVHKAQGKGCAPGILGIAIGGDRGTS
ncbi:MAG: fumarate hydratase, partial [Bacteriovoracaceae bacterium]